MVGYRYSKTDPRKDRSHYFYSSFEGIDFLREWAKVRIEIIEDLKIRDIYIPHLELPPDLGTAQIITAFQLRACAAAIANKQMGIKSFEAWGKFVQRKIDFSNCLYRAYSPEGKKISNESSCPETYAFAAYILSVNLKAKANFPERLKWLNAILKCLDILCYEKDANLDKFAVYCANRALQVEQEYVGNEVARLGILI